MVLPFKGLLYESTTIANGQMPAGPGRRMPCADMELNLIECLEAHGAIKGSVKCKQYYEDAQECKHAYISEVRKVVMAKETAKQLIEGKRTWSERFGKPYHGDSYVYGCFHP